MKNYFPNLTSKSVIKNILIKKGIYPSKKLGQNFLISKKVLEKIIEAANLKKQDYVLEIGPGIGTLTCKLAKKSKKTITIEKDEKMIKVLKQTLKGFKNIEIIKGDILKIPNSKILTPKSYKVVANIPYYITSPVIRKFLESENQPEIMVLMIQKEVAQRICSKPPKMNLLAISVQFYSNPKIISYVSKSCFWPKPKVDSAIIKLNVEKEKPKVDRKLFFKIVKAGFSHPRKQLVNNLFSELVLGSENKLKLEKEKVKLWLLKNKIKPEQRAQTLEIKDWEKLAKSFSKFFMVE